MVTQACDEKIEEEKKNQENLQKEQEHNERHELSEHLNKRAEFNRKKSGFSVSDVLQKKQRFWIPTLI
ncbi:hypothetical protein ACMX2M_07785 [Paenibacillus polymyxa]|nr:hypothetical protein MT997_22375 [Paenibacillus sp. OVF10]